MYIEGDMIVVSIRAHQYKLALRRQVLRIGGTKNRAQQYKLALRQRVIILKTTDFTMMYMKQTKTPFDILSVCVCVCLCVIFRLELTKNRAQFSSRPSLVRSRVFWWHSRLSKFSMVVRAHALSLYTQME